jgi:hypothetical protein
MNTRNIEPISIWTPSGQKSATILSLANFFDYHFDNGGGIVEYLLLGMESVGENPESAVQYYAGQLDIPSDVIQQWGEDDDVIWDYVATTLGLTLI